MSEARHRIGLRSPNWLGDAVMSLPALGHLQANYPQSSFVILTRRSLEDFWKSVEGVHEVRVVPKHLTDAARVVRDSDIDEALLLTGSLRTAAELWWGRVSRRCGFSGQFRSFLLTEAWSSRIGEKGDVHQKFRYAELAERFSGEEAEDLEVPRLNVAPRSEVGFVVCPGAEYGPAKRWGTERFAKVARRLAEERGWRITVCGGPKDVEVAGEFAERIGIDVENLAGRTSLREFIQILAGAQLILCNDSGAMHLAAVLRRPAVAVFGSTEPAWTGPLTDSVAVIRNRVECSPCFKRECPIDFPCMRGVSEAEVEAKAREVLATTGSRT